MAEGAFPNLLVIGAAKSGTSSLHFYLDLHPEISMSQPKELNFFLDDADLERSCADLAGRELDLFRERSNGHRGPDWYARFFDPAAAVRGESSVAYGFPWYPGVADRASRLVPGAKIIYLVREPVERAISHYSQYAAGREWRDADAALASDRSPYVEASRYATVLSMWGAAFPPESILVIDQAALRDRRKATMAQIFSFLGVDPAFWSPSMSVMRNRGQVKGRAFRTAERLRASRLGAPLQKIPKALKLRLEAALARPQEEKTGMLSQETASSLRAALQPEVARLERAAGLDLAGWSDISPGP